MDRLSLVLDLRKALWEISQTGGDTSLYVPKNYPRLNRLRKYVFSICGGQNIPDDSARHTRRHPTLAELLERERFENYIKYCTIRLRDLGVPQEDQERFLMNALGIVVPEMLLDPELPEQELSDANPIDLEDSISFEDMVLSKLVECFHPGYYPTIISVYEMLEEHMLAVWDFGNNRWQLTNLGRYALPLTTFSLLTFLLSIEINFTRNFRSHRYPTEAVLTRLLNEKAPQAAGRSGNRNPVVLRWYGILDYSRGKDELTNFGKQLLRRVVSARELMNDVILMLLEANDRGFEVTEDDSIIQKSFEFSRSTNLLSSSQEASIGQIMMDYEKGDYLGALTRFYPLIEGFIDSELSRRERQIRPRAGMGAKLAELVRCQAISSKLGAWGEIVNSRNKIVHGNLMDNDQEVLKPLLVIVASFWYQLLTQVTDSTSPDTNHNV